MAEWQDLAARDAPSLGQARLPEILPASFADWMVGHLTDEDLVEAKAYLDEARAALRAKDLTVPMPMQRRLDVDRRMVEVEAAALDRELEHRRTTGRPRAPPQILSRHARLSLPSAAGTRLERQALWEALRRYGARTNPKAEAERLRADLEVRGYEDEVERLVADGKRVAALKDAASRQRAEALQTQRAARLREGLAALHTRRPEQVRSLLDQIHEVDRSSAPGPSMKTAPGGSPARPYGDPVLLRCAASLESLPGFNAEPAGVAPQTPSASSGSTDVVQFSTQLAVRRRTGAEHPLVKAAEEADKPPTSPAAAAANDPPSGRGVNRSRPPSNDAPTPNRPRSPPRFRRR
jgi:hypothetical protein